MPWHTTERGRQTQRRAEKAYRKRLMQLGREAKRRIAEVEAAREAERHRVAEGVAQALAAFMEFCASAPRPQNPLALNRLIAAQERVLRLLRAIAER